MSSIKAWSGPAWRFLSSPAFFLPLAVFLTGLRYVGSGDTEPAELLPISILREGNLDFNEFVAGNDLPYVYRKVGHRVVSNYPILAGLLNVPVYTAAELLGVDLYSHRFLLSLLTASSLSALSVLFLYLALLKLCDSARQALFLSLVYAFGTCVWSVASRGLWQHTPAVLFLSAATWLLLAGDARRTALAGLMLGLAVASRPSNALLALPVAVFVLVHRRPQVLPFLALLAAPLALVSLYSAVYLGNPFLPGQPLPQAGFAGNMATGLAGLLVSPSRGLFLFSPIFLFSVAGGVLAWRSERWAPLRYLAVGAALVLLFYSFWGMWWGGATFGYRLLLDLVPILILLLALAWKRWLQLNAILRGTFFALLAFSIYVQVLGAYLYPSASGPNFDLEPARLWRVRDSEIVLLTRRLLFGDGGGNSGPVVPAVWWTPDKNDDAIPGWLDASPGGKTIRGPLEISGWAKSSTGEVDVRIALDDGRTVVPERFARPDVARVLLELGDTSHAGFRARLEPLKGELGDHALAVELRGPAGRVRRLGPIRFQWGW